MSTYPGVYGDFMIPQPTRRKVFVSYHHRNDQGYSDFFSTLFAEHHEMIHDNSLRGKIDSTDSEYVIRQIRERYITDTSCTIVLCGAETYQRRWVDWEILATLNKDHALIGIQLPTAPLTQERKVLIPVRLHDNIVSGYAGWIHWDNLMANPGSLPSIIEEARSRPKSLINNSRSRKLRNG